ncbi:MAG: hypothetical protein KatS3mg009_1913 [Acidimicrobiia bacterium]|nr:MAG: hypothetical protein KatS3mg009_1913 [Acidimicrobiia bacterium]
MARAVVQGSGGGPAGATLAHVPALDGIRALAVVAVLAFHAGVPGTGGGYLGVSLFFTLSGFLMGALLLREHEARGRISLARFWERRARRLLPASVLTIAGVALVARATDVFDRSGLGADLGASLAYGANWRFAWSGRSYAELFDAPSPVQHFWSLAIEEQFYLLFPLVVVALYRIGRGRRGALAAGLGALAVASVAAQLLTDDGDLAYYGTHTRAAELLAGALLACAVVRGRDARPAVTRVGSGAGFAALTAFGALVATAPDGGAWATGGGPVAVAAVDTVLVAAALGPSGPLVALLGSRPLVAIGRVSYGLYLFHWPVFLALDAPRTGLDGAHLLVLRLTVTVALAVCSYHLVECPIRYGRVGRRPAVVLAAGAAVSLATVAAIAAVPGPANRVALDGSAFTPQPGASSGAGDAGPAPLRVMVVGDSTATVSATALAARDDMIVLDASRRGCPLLESPVARWHPEEPARPVAPCAGEHRRWADELRLFRPEVVVVISSVEDVGAHDFLAQGGVGGAFDGYRAIVRGYEAVIGELRATGAVVAWADIPLYTFADRPDLRARMDLDTRVRAFNWAITQATSNSLGAVVLDYASRLDRPDGTVDLSVRPDGVHLAPAAAEEAARTWLADAVRVAQREARAELGLPTESGRDRDRLRVLVAGDSTSLAMATGLANHARAHRDLVVDWAGQPGCPLLPTLEVRIYDEPIPTESCEHPAERWPARARAFGADAVVVFSSFMDVMPVRLPDGRWAHIGTPEFDALYRQTVDEAIAALTGRGVAVVWADAPAPLGMEQGFVRDRLDALDRLVGDRVSAWPRAVTLPFARHVADVVTADPGAARAARPDGVHFTEQGATDLADWLVDAIRVAVDEADREPIR